MSFIRLFLLSIIALLPACSQLSYYAQAAKGQWEIVSKRQDIQHLLSDSTLGPELKTKLELVEKIRDFAVSELGLPDNKTFRSFTDLERQYVVWNVIATPTYDITPKTWCFPVAGCVAYKGFFSETSATELNDTLISQGYDTYTYGVSAYSTLGWFSDPVLNTFINYNEISLAGLIFHELAHQVMYLKDDSAFNEGFATAVEIAGVEKWISQNHNEEKFNDYAKQREDNNQITEMVLGFRNQLVNLYAESAESDLAKSKSKLFQIMKTKYERLQDAGRGTRFYDWWFGLDLNNAHLSAISTYHRLVPAYLAVMSQSESMNDFFNTIETQGKLPKSKRDKWLEEVLNTTMSN